MDEIDINDIIAELDQEYTGTLPERAIREAQRRPAEITPSLIELIRKATDAVRRGQIPKGGGHLFALFLLAEFRAKEALPAILEAVSLPGDGPFDLYGDSITEDLSRILVVLINDKSEMLDELIVNKTVNQYVRWKAANAYLYLVRDGRLTREQAVQRLREHLHAAIVSRDADVASGLVAELVSYAPREALDEIKEAFRCGLVERAIVGLDTVERSIAEGESRFRKELEYCRPTGVQDTILELSRWAAFQERPNPKPAPANEHDRSDILEDDEPWNPPATIRDTSPRVGRNDPCPCGSGKKIQEMLRSQVRPDGTRRPRQKGNRRPLPALLPRRHLDVAVAGVGWGILLLRRAIPSLLRVSPNPF